jgi:hypothetical protein
MYGSALGWEWFVETVPHCELFLDIDHSNKQYNVQLLHVSVVFNRRINGKSVYRSGDS